MKMTAQEIAKKFKGNIVGNPSVEIHQLSKIETATVGSLTFLANPKYELFLDTTKASIVLVNSNKSYAVKTATLIQVNDAYAAFSQLLMEWAMEKQEKKRGIDASANIHSSVKMADDVHIDPFVFIGKDTVIGSGVSIGVHSYIGNNVIIGNDSVLHPRVTLLDDTEVGERCIFQSGVVLGSDGFGFVPQHEKIPIKIPQLGKVIIKDDVEIGANSTVDRATLDATIIHNGVKLDNLVQIAHNVEIGPRTMIASQTGVAGSTKIGADCKIGGQVGIIGHLTLGDNIQIQGQTGVISDVPSGATLQGTPAFDYRSYYKSYAVFKNLPELKKKLESVEKK